MVEQRVDQSIVTRAVAGVGNHSRRFVHNDDRLVLINHFKRQIDGSRCSIKARLFEHSAEQAGLVHLKTLVDSHAVEANLAGLERALQASAADIVKLRREDFVRPHRLRASGHDVFYNPFSHGVVWQRFA